VSNVKKTLRKRAEHQAYILFATGLGIALLIALIVEITP
jgi:hypothetical protein